jgi:hypothetical protein
VIKYDTQANEWSTLESMPWSASEHSACVHEGVIYILGSGPFGETAFVCSGVSQGRLKAFLDCHPRTAACDWSSHSVAWHGHLDLYIVFSLLLDAGPVVLSSWLRHCLPGPLRGCRTSGHLAFSCQAKLIAQLLSSICYGTVVISPLFLVPLCLAPVVARQVVLPLHVHVSCILLLYF